MKTKLLLFFLIVTVIKVNAQQEIYSFLNYPREFIEFNNNIFFSAFTEDSGHEMWQSDGTASNTTLLKDLNPRSENPVESTISTGSAILNNTLYFIAKDGNSEGEIWKTDGTKNGTTKVTSFLNGRVSKLTAAGNYLYFLITLDDNNLEVWKTDGTSTGTVLVKDNLHIWNTPSFQGKCNNTFIFTFQPYGSNDSRVWRSDGTSEGTFPITSEIDGNGSYIGGTSALTQYIESNNKLYFVSRYSLYETDGTLENTKDVASLWNAGQNLVQYGDAIEANNNLYFMFFSAEKNKLSIWKFDLSSRNAAEIYTTTSPQYFAPSAFTKIADSLLFTSSDQTGVTSLFSLNLANYTVTNLKDLSKDLQKPPLFMPLVNNSVISKINNDEYFISSAENNYMKKGWILNIKLNTTEYISALDNVFSTISYKEYLYYAKDNKLYKYAKNLNVPNIDAKITLTIYPNPSSDFVQINTADNDIIESAYIYDINGKSVTNTINLNNGKIDISKLTKGSYFIQIKINGIIFNKKIIKG